ncbi:hypothetical protein OROMI_022813 [Orobanche minor]
MQLHVKNNSSIKNLDMDDELYRSLFSLLGVVVFILFIFTFTIICNLSTRDDDDDAPPSNEVKLQHIGVLIYDTCTKEGLSEEVGGGCTICIKKYDDDQQRATISACSHRFHKDCVEKWLRKFDSCPLCRHNLA